MFFKNFFWKISGAKSFCGFSLSFQMFCLKLVHNPVGCQQCLYTVSPWLQHPFPLPKKLWWLWNATSVNTCQPPADHYCSGVPGCGYGCQSMTCRGKSPFSFAWTHISLTFCMGLRHPSVLITQYQWEHFFSLVLDILCKSSSFYTNSTKQKYRIHFKYIYSTLLYSIQYANYI